MTATRKLWPEEPRSRLIAIFGVIVVLSVILTGLWGIVFEATGLARSAGAGSFAQDTAFRLGATVVFAALAWLPYHVALKMYRNWPRTVFFFAVLVFLVDVSQRFYAYVLSDSSTAGLIDLFLPFWLAGALVVLWAVLALIRHGRGGRGRDSFGGPRF